jgi:KaiC/GvpD/RAD55 family RecA-like ATPase
LLKIFYLDILKDETDFFELLNDLITSFNPQRLVVDSMTTLTDYASISKSARKVEFSLVEIQDKILPTPLTDQLIIKKILYTLIFELKKYGATALLTSELPEKTDHLSADNISEFITDGVLVLKALAVGDTLNRTLEIRKMRYSSIDGGIKSYEFGEKGIILE